MKRLPPLGGRRMRRCGLLAAALLGPASLVTSCSTTPAVISSSPTTAPTTTSTTTTVVGPPQPATTSTTQVSIPLSAIADSGLPSHVGEGPLKAAQIKTLMQFFEDEVAQAYGSGNPDTLDSYLAGPMLSGNKATINVLNGQSQRNVFKIDVTKVSIDNNEKDRAVFDMNGNMTTDYFEDTKTKQPVADGLPGPSAVNFQVFFDFNPTNHTWYWTGEQNLSTSANSQSGGSN
jgi:hypothetical protein